MTGSIRGRSMARLFRGVIPRCLSGHNAAGELAIEPVFWMAEDVNRVWHPTAHLARGRGADH
jgi:hypothetical protein